MWKITKGKARADHEVEVVIDVLNGLMFLSPKRRFHWDVALKFK